MQMRSNSNVLHCFSHGECPSEDTTAMFIRLCERFIEGNPTELIGKSLFPHFSCGVSVDVNKQWLNPIVLGFFFFKYLILVVQGQIRLCWFPQKVSTK